MPLSEKSIDEVNEFYSGKTILSTTGCDWELFNSVLLENNSKEPLQKLNIKSLDM